MRTFKEELAFIAKSIKRAKTVSDEKRLVSKFFKVLTEVDGMYLVRPLIGNIRNGHPKSGKEGLTVAAVKRLTFGITKQYMGFAFEGIANGELITIDETFISNKECKKVVEHIAKNL